MVSQGSLKTMEEGGRRIGEGGVRTEARCENSRNLPHHNVTVLHTTKLYT